MIMAKDLMKELLHKEPKSNWFSGKEFVKRVEQVILNLSLKQSLQLKRHSHHPPLRGTRASAPLLVHRFRRRRLCA